MIKKVLIMAGGTGGHVFPGIALGKALQQKNIEVLWLGSTNGMETQLVPKSGFELFTLDISGFRGKKFLHQLLLPLHLIQAIFKACKILKKIKPDIVIGMGGFAAGPGGIAAKFLNIPLYIHEQNSIAGLTNKILAKFAKKVFCAFPNTFPASNKVIVTGNPVREELQQLSPKEKPHSPARIFVFGGSRGAKAINEMVPKALDLLSQQLPIEIIHQTGQNNSAAYQSPARTMLFIDNMAEIYQWTDVVICRSGALTLAEITAIGIPAILIPFPYAVDDHQTANARYLEKNHGAIVIPQATLSSEKLAADLKALLIDLASYAAMAKASRALGNPNALSTLIHQLLAIN